MSKFNVGDKVYLLPSSGWVNQSSLEFESSNPLNVEGFIDEVNGYEYSIMWGNGQHNYCYTDDDLILAEDKQPEQDCPYNIIEELSAQVDNLEQLVSEQAARIRQVDTVLANFARLTQYFSEEGAGKLPNSKIGDDVVDAILDYFKGTSEQVFKPISEYTLHDWQDAVQEGWKFETRAGNVVGIKGTDSTLTCYPVLSDEGWLRMNGWEWEDETSGMDIIRRVS